MNKKIFLLLAVIFSLFLLAKSTVAFAYTCSDGREVAISSDCGSNSNNSNSDVVQLDDPLGKGRNNSIPLFLGQIINAVLGVVGSLTLIMLIFGGVTWMTSAGNAERVTKGKNIIIWAALGLVVIFSAYGLVRFVLTSLGS